jgi:aldehyde dehydrogenase (NAD+)
LPTGVVNFVTGQDPALGAELASNPLVDKVSFTGSGVTGKKILAAAAPTMKRVHLELGGKSALLILDDAFDAIVNDQLPAIASPAYFHAGQGCALRTRVLVSRKKHDELVERVRGLLSRMVKIGNPTDPTVSVGPLIREERRVAVEALIASGKEEGAQLVYGGGRPAGKGFFVEPTVFANVRNDMRIAREEVFGPILCILPYEGEADAIKIANDSRYGLAGGILSADVMHAIEIARQLRTGGVSVNGASNAMVTPFGGMKESGLGREGGTFGIEEYTELQSVSWPA